MKNVIRYKNGCIVVNKTSSTYAEIFVYGYIADPYDADSVSAGKFVQELRELEKHYSTIKIRINSGGGSIFDGLAIFNAIKSCKADTEAYIDGMAASMALPVALACDRIYISRFGMVMTHKGTVSVFGNAADMLRAAELVETLENSILLIISERTGLSIAECKIKYMGDGDRWLTSGQAITEKLVDSVYDGTPVTIPQDASTAQIVGCYNSALSYESLIVTDNSTTAGHSSGSTPVNSTKTDSKGYYDTAFRSKLIKEFHDLEASGEIEMVAKTDWERYSILYEAVYGMKPNPASNVNAPNKKKSITDKLPVSPETKELLKEWEQMENEGKSEFIAKHDWERYCQLYKARYGVQPNAAINPNKDKAPVPGQQAYDYQQRKDLANEFTELDNSGGLAELAKHDWGRYSQLYEAKYNEAPNPASNPNYRR